MSFQQGLSGLNLSSRGLDVVGNNISNSQTVGFKGAVGQFNDVYAAMLASTGSQVGQGGAVMNVAQQFTQGNVTSTNNPLDIAINGQGFMRFQPGLNDATPQYSRNGQLHLNAQGYIVNAQDQYLAAYKSPDGITIDATQTVPLQFPLGQLQPQQTGWSDLAVPGSGGVFIGANLDVRDKKALNIADPAPPGWTANTPWDFATLNPSMYNYSTSVSVFDQSGQSHVMTMYFIRQGDETQGASQRQWETHFVMDNQYEITNVTDINGNAPMLEFTANGKLDTTNIGSRFTLDMTSAVDKNGNGFNLTDDDPGSAGWFHVDNNDPTKSIPVTFDFREMTSFGSPYDVSKSQQDGFTAGMLAGMSIDGDGMVSGRYSNGQSQIIGQIPLTSFQNPNGLVSLGNNMWAPSAASGSPLEGMPRTGNRGSIKAASVEDSNVDLTKELVDMITLQRAYQANAQTIKTQDSIMQTLVNLR